MNGTSVRLAALLLIPLVLIAGCDVEPSATDALSAARAAIAKRDFRSAGIGLRALLQSEPNSAQARLMFGETLLEMGEPGLAAVELRKAAELSIAAADVVPMLARAMLLSGQSKALVEEFGKRDLVRPDANADLQTTLAIAYGSLGRRAESQIAIDEALRLAPNNPNATVFQARLRADSGDHAAAVSLLQQLLVASPTHADAWRTLGDIQSQGLRDVNAALSSYAKAVEVSPSDLNANSALIYSLVQERKIKDAELALSKMQVQFPGHPQTKFFQALFAFNNRDYKSAREILQQLLQRSPNNLWFLQLAGTNEFAAGSLVQAEGHLNKALQAYPDAAEVRGSLARIYLANGHAQRAVDVLQPLLSASSPGAGAMAVAAEAYLAAGDSVRANELFAKAVNARPDEVGFRVGQARAGLAGSKPEQALADLVNLAAQDKDISADMVLVQALVVRGDLQAAAKAAEVLQSKRPDAAFAASLRGDIALRAGDSVQARKHFERALTLAKADVPAAAGLSAIELQAGQLDAALKRLVDLVVANPTSVPALLALAEMQTLQRVQPAEILKSIDRAVEIAPDNAKARAALIRYHLKQRDAKRAQVAAVEAVSRLPNRFELLALLAQAQFLTGEVQQAKSTVAKWAGLQPKLPQPYIVLGDLWAGKGDYPEALESYRRALQLAPDAIDVNVSIIQANLEAKRPELALSAAQDYARRRPDSMIGHMMVGDVHIARKEYAQAAVAYRTASGKRDATVSATDKLYQALYLAGKPDVAEQVADAWISAHPADAVIPLNAGRMALSKKNYALAERRFAAMLSVKPDDPAALNNLAYAKVQLGKPGALVLAEKAVSLMPDAPQMLDTLAAAQAAEGQFSKAIDTQRLAMAKPGGQKPAFQLGLAKILLQAGQRPQAADLLKTISTLPGQPAEALEAAALLTSIS